MTYIAFQFWFITKQWKVNAYISLTLAVTSLICSIVWMPESFRYYYSTKKFTQARFVLAKAAKYNKKSFDFVNGRFEAELSIKDHGSNDGDTFEQDKFVDKEKNLYNKKDTLNNTEAEISNN